MREQDVERLLVWAVAHTKPETRGGSGSSYEPLILGTRVSSDLALAHYSSSIVKNVDPNALRIMSAIKSLDRRCIVGVDTELLFGLSEILPDGFCDVGSFDERNVVMENARADTRPSWNLKPRPLARLAGNGSPSLVGKRYAKSRYSHGSYCPIVWADPAPETVIAMRARYAVWHRALGRIAELLNNQLESLRVLPPTAPARPWLA